MDKSSGDVCSKLPRVSRLRDNLCSARCNQTGVDALQRTRIQISHAGNGVVARALRIRAAGAQCFAWAKSRPLRRVLRQFLEQRPVC